MPGYRDYNLETDLKSAQQVFRRWPTPIVVSGFEVGDAIRYPARRVEQDYRYVPHHPLAEAYKLYMPPPYDGPMWDPTSVIYAVRPEAGYFGLSPPGRVIVEVRRDGIVPFQAEANGPHRYLSVTPEQAGIVVAPEGVKTCPGKSITIAANQVYENGLHGIFVANPEASKIAVFGNHVRNNAIGGAPNSGIAVRAQDVEVQGNTCWDDQLKKTQEYGVALLTGAVHCRVLNNRVAGNKLGGLFVHADVKDCLVKNNVGYITENSGIARGRSPITIAHGLAPSVDPTTIRVTLGAKGDKRKRRDKPVESCG